MIKIKTPFKKIVFILREQFFFSYLYFNGTFRFMNARKFDYENVSVFGGDNRIFIVVNFQVRLDVEISKERKKNRILRIFLKLNKTYP